MMFNLLTWPLRWWLRRKIRKSFGDPPLDTAALLAEREQDKARFTLADEHGHTIGSATQPELDEAQEAGKKAFPWPVEPRFKEFDDGLVGEDITDLDYGDVDELRRVYGPKGIIPDHKLVQWAADVQADRRRAAEVRERLRAIEAMQHLEPIDNGYRPASGPSAGTSPGTGIVYPPKVTDLTTKEWCELRLEQAYGLGKMPAILAADLTGARAVGFSMRHLNGLIKRAEQRDASLTAYEIAILRSRGLV